MAPMIKESLFLTFLAPPTDIPMHCFKDFNCIEICNLFIFILPLIRGGILKTRFQSLNQGLYIVHGYHTFNKNQSLTISYCQKFSFTHYSSIDFQILLKTRTTIFFLLLVNVPEKCYLSKRLQSCSFHNWLRKYCTREVWQSILAATYKVNSENITSVKKIVTRGRRRKHTPSFLQGQRTAAVKEEESVTGE